MYITISYNDEFSVTFLWVSLFILKSEEKSFICEEAVPHISLMTLTSMGFDYCLIYHAVES